jgi:hypothetical protein
VSRRLPNDNEVRQRLPEPLEPVMILAKLAEHPTMDDKELCSPKK